MSTWDDIIAFIRDTPLLYIQIACGFLFLSTLTLLFYLFRKYKIRRNTENLERIGQTPFNRYPYNVLSTRDNIYNEVYNSEILLDPNQNRKSLFQPVSESFRKFYSWAKNIILRDSGQIHQVLRSEPTEEERMYIRLFRAYESINTVNDNSTESHTIHKTKLATDVIDDPQPPAENYLQNQNFSQASQRTLSKFSSTSSSNLTRDRQNIDTIKLAGNFESGSQPDFSIIPEFKTDVTFPPRWSNLCEIERKLAAPIKSKSFSSKVKKSAFFPHPKTERSRLY
ncbi:hypothetical protein BB560_002377 [Smittium megazygosporum]|uniref:Uncharacterized protein n=1 Tax=Smittium megazygosporum TaxID=133381 RepID=A0A2T9ZF36_9FUNG|nr:hypothetical protein BB560_002377 [Smittium megazygosporum]